MTPNQSDLQQIALYYREKKKHLDLLWVLVLLSLLADGFVLSENLPDFLGDQALLWWGLLPLSVSFLLDRSSIRFGIVDNYLRLRAILNARRSLLLWIFIALFALACVGISFRALETGNFAQLIFSFLFFLATFSSIWHVLRQQRSMPFTGHSLEIFISVQSFLVLSVLQILSARLCSLAGAVIAAESHLNVSFYLLALAISIFLILESKPELTDFWRICPRCSKAYPCNLYPGPACKYCKASERS